jgi:hypothetical protein
VSGAGQRSETVATDEVREANQSHVCYARLLRASATRVCYARFDSPVPGEGEIGCLFDEISNLEPIERPATEGWAGWISHGRRDVCPNGPADEE